LYYLYGKCKEQDKKYYSGEKAIKAKKKWKGRTFVAGFLFILVISYAYLDKYAFNNEEKEAGYNKPLPQSTSFKKEPVFIKEGELRFIDQITKKNIKTIDIEIANTPKEMETGLMYRRSMPETAMLFRFDRFKPAFFWMRNTYIPLDMIFVDKNMKIVKIHRDAEPLSDKQIPAHKETLYTIEVNAGFCEQHGIAIGDHVIFHQF
jgi:uncharacterized membrane protein (UPF0127 family)